MGARLPSRAEVRLHLKIAERSLAPMVRAEFDADQAVEVLPLDPAVVSRDIRPRKRRWRTICQTSTA